MKTKALTAGALSLAIVAALTACGNDNDDAGGKSGEKITLNLMHLWPEGTAAQQNKLVKQIIEEYKAMEPNVTIATEVLENEQYKDKMQVLSASNKLPDIGLTWAAGYMEPYVKGNKFATVDDLLQGELKDKFVAGTTEAYASGGKSYALPLELNIVPVYYNKEIFAKYGLQPPQTLDDLKNVIGKLNENGVTPITMGGKDAWTASFWYMYLADRFGGADLLDQSVAGNAFTDPALIDAAKAMQELVDMKAFIKGFNGLSNDEAKAEFENEKAAMYAMGTWEVPNYTTNPDRPQAFKDKIGFFKFPTVAGGKGELNDFVGGPGVGLFVSENSAHKEEAKKFVGFFVRKWGEHSVVDAGVIPATKVDTAAIKLPQMFIDLLNELNGAKKVTLYLDVQMKPGAAQEHYNLVQALLGKEITPEEFAKKQEEALQAGK
ncbi:extracellular solute-binding protein [Cohnella sp. GCM10027633]|uniref:extracellular solute-binding protein n=1 Tax=unclassified Cohnella TaxID=2636738 RepID=UPI00363D8BEA